MTLFWVSLVSLWTWLVLIVCVLLWLPLMLAVRLATLADAGRYQAGYLFRQVGVITARLTPYWKFSYRGTMPADPRRPYEPETTVPVRPPFVEPPDSPTPPRWHEATGPAIGRMLGAWTEPLSDGLPAPVRGRGLSISIGR